MLMYHERCSIKIIELTSTHSLDTGNSLKYVASSSCALIQDVGEAIELSHSTDVMHRKKSLAELLFASSMTKNEFGLALSSVGPGFVGTRNQESGLWWATTHKITTQERSCNCRTTPRNTQRLCLL